MSVDSQPLPLSLPATQVSTGNTEICPTPNTAINEAINMTREYLQQVGAFLSLPSSCAEIAGQNESITPGLYWIRNGNDSAIEIYCSAEGGTRVAFLNMTDPAERCVLDHGKKSLYQDLFGLVCEISLVRAVSLCFTAQMVWNTTKCVAE